MKRILVIQDVSLWIDLNRHLSGVASVDLVEALSFETGQILAQLERPSIIVCGRESGGPEPAEFLEELRAGGLDAVRVISVREDAADPGQLAGVSNSELIECTSERLLSLVTDLLAFTEDRSEGEVELLAHYELDAAGDEDRRGFAVVLELTPRRLVIESDWPLETGDVLALNFFLPASSGSGQRVKVNVSCVVAQCRDETKLHYSVRVSKIGEASTKAIARYVAGLER